MLGPLVQGFMLMGVIYFYSKSILSLINEYYRDEFKSQLDKDLEKFEKMEKNKIDVNEIEKGKGKIFDKKDIIPSPVIEGIPDIFHSPAERTSLVITPDEEEKLFNSRKNLGNNDNDIKFKKNEAEMLIEKKNEKITKPPPQSSSQEKSECSDNPCTSSSNSISSNNCNNNHQLLDSVKSLYEYSQSHDVIGDSNKESILNPLPSIELNYKHNKNNDELDESVVSSTVSHSQPHHSAHHLHQMKMERQQNYLDNINGNYVDDKIEASKKLDDAGETENKKNEYQYRNRFNKKLHRLDSKEYKIYRNDVCTVRRKSVNEMIQYWNRQVSLYEDNLQVKERRQSIENFHLNINGST